MGLKKLVYRLSKGLGLFRLAGLATRRKLRILCYHGFALDGEDAFRGKLFLSPETFRRRMRSLERAGIPVLPLDEALQRMREGTLPNYATVLTIDDGFYSVHRAAMPVLAEHRFPATLYVTSYYMLKQTPIFRLVVQYMFWKTDRARVDVGGLIPGESDGVELDRAGAGAWMWKFIEYGETRCDEPERCRLSEQLGRRLGVSYADIASKRILSLVDEEEARELLENGIDIQLHTHRHRLPCDREIVMRELKENDDALAAVTGGRLRHFCYPSGEWSRDHWPWLAASGVASAVTCERGLNTAATPPLALYRFLDGQEVSDIEFEAEIYGFSEIVRALRRMVKGGSADAGRRAGY